jgi:hypothetical protein
MEIKCMSCRKVLGICPNYSENLSGYANSQHQIACVKCYKSNYSEEMNKIDSKFGFMDIKTIVKKTDFF